MISLFQDHARRWRKCDRCDLCNTRNHVTIARGKVPCRILFIGEAPGDVEDVTGVPFHPNAPAGGLLQRRIIDRSLVSRERYALTNLIGCIPKDAETAGKSKEGPPDYAIKSCAPRLQEFVQIANPELVVTVGAHAETFTAPGYLHTIKFDLRVNPARAHIVHPAWILRQPTASQELHCRRCVIALDKAVQNLPELLKQAQFHDDIPF